MGAPEGTDRCVMTFENLSSTYKELEIKVAEFNSSSKWKKKGLAISPMKYPMDVSFHSNSVLLSVYRQDGSVQLTIGGIDMGQERLKLRSFQNYKAHTSLDVSLRATFSFIVLYQFLHRILGFTDPMCTGSCKQLRNPLRYGHGETSNY